METMTNVLNHIAQKEKNDCASIRREMELAMEIGMNNPDPKVQAVWAAIPCRGEKPTVEELISWAVSQLV